MEIPFSVDQKDTTGTNGMATPTDGGVGVGVRVGVGVCSGELGTGVAGGNVSPESSVGIGVPLCALADGAAIGREGDGDGGCDEGRLKNTNAPTMATSAIAPTAISPRFPDSWSLPYSS
jgi:hypothetical protein